MQCLVVVSCLNRDDSVLALCLCTFVVSVPWRVLHISVPADGRLYFVYTRYIGMLSLVASCRFVSLPFSFPRFYTPGRDLESWGGAGEGVHLRASLSMYLIILRPKRVIEDQYVTTVPPNGSRS